MQAGSLPAVSWPPSGLQNSAGRADSISLLFQTQKFFCNSLLIAILDTRQPAFKILIMSVPLAAWFEETVGYLSLFSCICLVIPAFSVAHAP